MAASSWRDEINCQEFCKALKERNSKELPKKHQNESGSLLCLFGSDLYTWDQSQSRIIYCNLKSFGSADSHSEAYSSRQKSILDLSRADNTDALLKNYQSLQVSGVISLDVENLTINRCGTHIVVWGSKGIKVVELPRRWGRNGMFEGGKAVISCRATTIGERSYGNCHSVRIRQVSWHPGSKTDSHIAVLSSDNLFSVYDINKPEEPMSVVNVTTGDVSFALSPNTKSLVSAALGETAVAFDFGMPVTLNPKQRPFQTANTVTPVLEVWPVYCVCGNGDVLILYSNMSSLRQIRLPVQGPVSMYPPAEDNYGVDACSILCLPTPLPVIIISTCEGSVHHCVQLPGDDQQNQTLQSEASPAVSPPSMVSISPMYESISEPVFFVVETAELELCLSTPTVGELPSEEDDFMCPVKLKKDPCSNDRYHCSHSAGVHSVALPWLNLVQQFFLEESGDFDLPENKSCVVEHLVCTKPLHSCPLSPILGMDVVTDVTLGPHLIVLSSEYEFITLPIGFQYRLGSTGENGSKIDTDVSSPIRRQSREPFSQHIQQLLQRKTSLPLLKCSSSTEVSQQECFQLLSRVTQVLREEYMQKQDHARQEIDTRIRILKEHKEHQLDDLRRLTQDKLMLRERAHNIAENVENAKEKHDELLKRLESILRGLQSRVPTLSEAEKQMMKELNKLEGNMQLYKQNVEQVKTKLEYQDRQLSKKDSKSQLSISSKQFTQIHSVLKEEGDDIQELKSEIRRLSITVSGES